MPTFKNRLKETLNAVLRPRGWELERCVGFGRDLAQDLATLSGGRAIQTVFDVGAHHGETAREFSQRYPQARIYSFEPFDESFEELRRATAGHPGVVPVKLGLSDTPGLAKLHLNRGSATNSLLPNTPESSQFQPSEFCGETGTTEIGLTTLDAYCEQQNIGFIDLLKIDAQGSELRILHGARRLLAAGKVALFHCEVLFVPLYDGQPSSCEIQEFLRSYDLALVGFYNLVRNEEHRLLWGEALFFHPNNFKRLGAPA